LGSRTHHQAITNCKRCLPSRVLEERNEGGKTSAFLHWSARKGSNLTKLDCYLWGTNHARPPSRPWGPAGIWGAKRPDESAVSEATKLMQEEDWTIGSEGERTLISRARVRLCPACSSWPRTRWQGRRQSCSQSPPGCTPGSRRCPRHRL